MWQWEKRTGRSNAGVSLFNWELGNSWIDVATMLLIPVVPAASQSFSRDFLRISMSGSKAHLNSMKISAESFTISFLGDFCLLLPQLWRKGQDEVVV